MLGARTQDRKGGIDGARRRPGGGGQRPAERACAAVRSTRVGTGGLALAVRLLALFVALGCASQQTVVVWEKPGAGPDELEAAQQACLAEVEALHTDGVNRTRFEAEATGSCFVACMKRHGFTWRTENVSPRDRGGAGAVDSDGPPPPDQGSSGSSPATSGCSSTGAGLDGS
jgi:hypothetical protein